MMDADVELFEEYASNPSFEPWCDASMDRNSIFEKVQTWRASIQLNQMSCSCIETFIYHSHKEQSQL